jgi:hypothetical protein
MTRQRLPQFLLAGGGYSWTVIRLEGRAVYMTALEQASVVSDVGPFARFIADSLRRSRRL